MTHVRQQIREAVANKLDAASEITAPVYKSRVHSLADVKLPAVLVYTTEESSERLSMDPELARECTLQIVAAVKNTGNFDDEADELSAQIERAMFSDRLLGGLAKELVLESTEIELVGDGDKPVGAVTLEYTVAYVTAISDPSVNL